MLLRSKERFGLLLRKGFFRKHHLWPSLLLPYVIDTPRISSDANSSQALVQLEHVPVIVQARRTLSPQRPTPFVLVDQDLLVSFILLVQWHNDTDR